MNALSINDISKKKYQYYKKLNSRKNDWLFLVDLTSISPNTKAIKYIGKIESKINSTINIDFNRKSIIVNKNLTAKTDCPSKRKKLKKIKVITFIY